MKKIFLLSCFLSLVMIANAQNYSKVPCNYCGTNGWVYTGYYNYYGYPITAICPQCKGNGYIVTSKSTSPSFRGSKLVQLRSASGGTSYGFGTYYSIENVVVYEGKKLKATTSDVRGFNKMIKFSNGVKWYFNY